MSILSLDINFIFHSRLYSKLFPFGFSNWCLSHILRQLLYLQPFHTVSSFQASVSICINWSSVATWKLSFLDNNGLRKHYVNQLSQLFKLINLLYSPQRTSQMLKGIQKTSNFTQSCLREIFWAKLSTLYYFALKSKFSSQCLFKTSSLRFCFIFFLIFYYFQKIYYV